MKKASYYFFASAVLLACLIGIPFSFIGGDTMGKWITRTCHLKIDSSMTGGELAADIFDDAEDDNGIGNLEYPENTFAKKGSLDLVRYKVHKPVYNARWQTFHEYWQLSLEYISSPDDLRNIMIYIDADGNRQGSTTPLFNDETNCTFTDEHPWDYAIWIFDKSGKIYGSDKKEIEKVQICNLENGKKITIRIPLEKKEMHKIYSSKKTYHYVLTGILSKCHEGGFQKVSEGPGIFDILDDSSSAQSQKIQLNSYRTNESGKSILIPIVADMKGTPQKIDDRIIKEIKSACSIENTIPEYDDEKLNLAVKEFTEGKMEDAESKLKNIIHENPENAIALAYYGSCLASRAGKSSAFKALKLVNESYKYLDKAVEISRGTMQELDVLLNRASVSSAVPDVIFGKASAAVKDYERCLEILNGIFNEENLLPEQRKFLAHMYACAYESCMSAENDTSAHIYLKKAEKIWNEKDIEIQ